MKRGIYIVILAVVFSFAWGLWYGLYSLEKNKPAHLKGQHIRILVKKNFLPRGLTHEISIENEVNLQVVEVESDWILLKEIVSPSESYDLIQVPSYLIRNFLVENVIQSLDPGFQKYFSNISVDFKNLDFDPANKYLFPITWGVNGFLVRKDLNSKSDLDNIDDLLALNQSQLTWTTLPNPVDLFFLAIRLKPSIRGWAESGNENQLMKEVKEIRARLGQITLPKAKDILTPKIKVLQTSNGMVPQLIAEDPTQHVFVLPKERARLWVNCLAVPLRSENPALAHKVMAILVHPKWSQKLVEVNHEATVLTSLNDSTLPNMKKAKFIRELPISRVELFADSEAVEPMWMGAYRWLTGQE